MDQFVYLQIDETAVFAIGQFRNVALMVGGVPRPGAWEILYSRMLRTLGVASATWHGEIRDRELAVATIDNVVQEFPALTSVTPGLIQAPGPVLRTLANGVICWSPLPNVGTDTWRWRALVRLRQNLI